MLARGVFVSLAFVSFCCVCSAENGQEMAGAVSSSGGSSSAAALRVPVLQGVAQLPPESLSPRSNQLGNASPLTPLETRASDDYDEDSISGVALANDILENLSDESKGLAWSSSWLVDADPGEGKRVQDRCFSSEMSRTPDVDQWVQVELKAPQEISKVSLLPRDAKGTGFPLDFQLLASLDGEHWTTLLEKRAWNEFGAGKAVEFEFPPLNAKFVRLKASKLRPEGSVFYFQLSRFGVFGVDGENWAWDSKGAVARASAPLSLQAAKRDEFFKRLLSTGVRWVFFDVNYGALLKRAAAGEPAVTATALKNVAFLRAHGVRLICRLNADGLEDEMLKDPRKAASRFAEAVSPVVKAFKGEISVWAIANEENMHAMYKYKAAIDRNPPATVETWKAGYVELVKTASDEIRKLDPGSKVEIETALFDFGWTRDVLDAGLASKVDAVGVHVYKEVLSPALRPEMAATFIRDGRRFNPEDQPFKSYVEEIAAFKTLLASKSPALTMNVTETSVNVLRDLDKPTCMACSGKSQAKFLARLYVLHCLNGVGPTCWWMYQRDPQPQVVWGLLDADGKGVDAWRSLQSFSALFDSSFKPLRNVKLNVEPAGLELVWGALKNPRGEILIPYWAPVELRDSNSGRAVDLTIEGVDAESAEAVDLLSGSVQKLDFEKRDGRLVFKNMVARDYPVVIRLDKRGGSLLERLSKSLGL